MQVNAQHCTAARALVCLAPCLSVKDLDDLTCVNDQEPWIRLGKETGEWGPVCIVSNLGRVDMCKPTRMFVSNLHEIGSKCVCFVSVGSNVSVSSLRAANHVYVYLLTVLLEAVSQKLQTKDSFYKSMF